MAAGEKNCFEVGSQILLQEKNGPERAKLKVLRVEIVPLNQLTVIHSSSMGLSYSEFYSLVQTSLESLNGPKNRINMTFFEYIADSANTQR
ncbi:hypothetical protein K2X05_00925, partial [bacterium]|nr:hypothetical protein [bacterium]